MVGKETQERIKADAIKLYPFPEQDGFRAAYIAGVTAENERAQNEITQLRARAKRLLDTLETILHAPVPANEREYMAWFVTAKNVAGGAISNWEAEDEVQQWKGEKEVGDGK